MACQAVVSCFRFVGEFPVLASWSFEVVTFALLGGSGFAVSKRNKKRTELGPRLCFTVGFHIRSRKVLFRFFYVTHKK